MTGTDLTLIVTAHDQSLVCGPTMESAGVAVEAARRAGWTVETVVALESPTRATRDYFDRPEFDDWDRWPGPGDDPGQTRDDLVRHSSGRFIAFLDAGDLFSENWLADGLVVLDAAERDGAPVVAHPEVNIWFDAGGTVVHNVGQASPVFSPERLAVRSCYDGLCLAPRRAHLEVPFSADVLPDRQPTQGWHFVVETMSRGWQHVVVADTIIFKRRREARQTDGRPEAIRAALPEMAIDRVRDLARRSPEAGRRATYE